MNARQFLFANAILFAVQMFAAAEAQDQVRVVGSSTVYPFATAVAEHFGKTSGYKSPVVESIGTGGGLQLFCASLDATSPDIATASRRIRATEIAACASHGVKEIAEIIIGFDGMVIGNAQSDKPLHLTHRQLFLAIAKTVPQGGKLVANPFRRWRDIDAALPDERILVFGPALNHGTRDSLVELVMSQACHEFTAIQALDSGAQEKICGSIREDGAFVDVSQNYAISLQKMIQEPHAVAILPFSYFDQNGDKVQAATFDGIEPTYDRIFSGQYPLSRPLFLYVKVAHLNITAGLRDYIADFTSEKAWSKDGYLSERGLIALPDDQRRHETEKVKDLLKIARQ
jgi:phosphate transport system substrate-binding protein